VGAIDETGWAYIATTRRAPVPTSATRAREAAQLAVLAERRASYTPARPPLDPAGRTVIVVDDGLATARR